MNVTLVIEIVFECKVDTENMSKSKKGRWKNINNTINQNGVTE